MITHEVPSTRPAAVGTLVPGELVDEYASIAVVVVRAATALSIAARGVRREEAISQLRSVRDERAEPQNNGHRTNLSECME